ncbi:TetR/AcrR family transcriptional regulator [Streptococcus moroccensis]|uniref:AcrR family transcriptional regulator n=1 Tax=Streptococcus moroccensis TaxID=1451356 RepID=A0ABT9YRT5_9STRE|nr:TetR/AcrR family transcriptional regulator [Streptococcus moroccensis]MDQ0222321.1 AcrR family transcriptional regulator [Streptococcus moroccensis]
MNTEDLRYLKTEQLIQQVFLDSVNAVGFDKVTVTSLCQKAQISRFTFYAHYDDKFQLQEKLFQKLEEKFKDSINAEVLNRARGGDFLSSVERFIMDVVQNKTIIKTMFNCNKTEMSRLLAYHYIDEPTAILVPNYYKKIAQTDTIRRSRLYLVAGLVSFIEDVVNSDNIDSLETLIAQYYHLSNEAGKYFNQQLLK